MHSEPLSKILLAVSSSLLLAVCCPNQVTMGSSTISNQLEVGSIMVRAMKSICKSYLPLQVYEPIRSTHKHSQRLLMLVLGGRYPYLRFRLLFVWKVLQDLIIDWMVVPIPFSTLRRSLSLWDVCVLGAVSNGDTIVCVCWLDLQGREDTGNSHLSRQTGTCSSPPRLHYHYPALREGPSHVWIPWSLGITIQPIPGSVAQL